VYINLIIGYNKSSSETKVIIMMKLTAVAGAVLTMALVGCGGGGGGSSPATASVAVTPATFALDTCSSTGVANSAATFTLTNQVWASPVPKDFTECVHGSATADGATATFDWNAGTPDNSVLSFPSIVYGQVPGYASSTTPKLPALVTNLPSLLVKGNVQTVCSQVGTCKFDTALDVYFVDTNGNKSAELMVFTEFEGLNVAAYQGYVAGAPVTIGVQTYNVINRMMTMQSGGQTYSWKYIAYIATSPIRTLNLDVAQFVADARTRQVQPDPLVPTTVATVTATEKLYSVELGTEVIAGSGTTTISNYSVK
jgi:hypothetical protein